MLRKVHENYEILAFPIEIQLKFDSVKLMLIANMISSKQYNFVTKYRIYTICTVPSCGLHVVPVPALQSHHYSFSGISRVLLLSYYLKK